HARGADPAVAEVLAELPERTYRDAAEVARALGALRRHEAKPSHAPSRLGGERALEAPSAARVASLLRGIDFPASGAELRAHARGEASEEEMALLERFGEGPFHDMAEVEEELGRVT
ncbi:MAG: DUF2795 domain-containing protein, partial [Myxococcota bacterium]|nr:DUF2795 domain-containing protein [Myxococcota bacterium]